MDDTTSTAGLVARTRRLEGDVDLLDVAGDRGMVWTRDGCGFAGHGEALRLDLSLRDPAEAARQVQQMLGAIEHDDRVGAKGCGPVALGAFPFERHAPGSLVVPALLVGRSTDGRRWVTTIGRDPARLENDEVVAPEPTEFTVRSERPATDWCASLLDARDALRSSGTRKVVLARAVHVRGDRELVPGRLLRRLGSRYPGCMLFALDGFVGASPELLVSRSGDVVRAHPMAGTSPRSADATTDARLAAALLASTKDREEHQITIDMVHDTLLPWCSFLDWEPEPTVFAMANVQHLATRMEGQLSRPPASVIELVGALHPTPAVCGDPRDDALDLIRRHEDLDRGRYAGPVGWVDAEGNGEWAVGIRSAEISGATARVFAGVGVVADSDPDAELAETRVKLEAMLSAIVRP